MLFTELVTMRKSVVMFAMVLSMVPVMYAATLHKVGGALGWNYPPTQGAGYFANWAAQNQFRVGDSLCKISCFLPFHGPQKTTEKPWLKHYEDSVTTMFFS